MNPEIFIVDDYQIQLNNLTKFLKQQYPHLIIIGFTDPVEALEQIIMNKPEILILDHAMPRLEGAELLKIVKKVYTPHTTILISMLDQYAELYDYYLPKPYHYLELKTLIDTVLEDIYKKLNIEIDGALSGVDGSIKDKIFLKNVLILLQDIVDDEQPQNASIYKLVSEKMDSPPDTVRKHMKRIRNKNQDKFGKVSTLELLKKILKKIRKG